MSVAFGILCSAFELLGRILFNAVCVQASLYCVYAYKILNVNIVIFKEDKSEFCLHSHDEIRWCRGEEDLDWIGSNHLIIPSIIDHLHANV